MKKLYSFMGSEGTGKREERQDTSRREEGQGWSKINVNAFLYIKKQRLNMKHIFAILILSGFHIKSFSQLKPVFKINHAAVYVTDLKRSGEFYTKILNLDTIPEPFHDNRHIWLSIGNGVQLHIIQGAQKEKEYFQNNHLCFSTDDVVSFSKKLDEHKIAWYSARGEA
ncbi:MAG: VOC family protein, partial [Bacteroidota bacterium]